MGELRDPRIINVERAREILRSHWERIKSEPEPQDFIKGREIEAVRRIMRGKILSYRYALLTQVLAKATDSFIDCLCLQVKRGGPGAFDARSFCKNVVVEFDGRHDKVLGGSLDPYVSKPLRREEISVLYRSAVRDKKGWDDLCFLLKKIERENDPDFTMRVLDQALLEISRRLAEIRVYYPIPRRISLDKVQSLIRDYLSEPSGGVRPEVIVYSLFKEIGRKFNLFKQVSSSKTTAPNLMMGRIADVECYGPEGKIALAINVKDHELTREMVNDQILKIHTEGVPNLLFMAFRGIREVERGEIYEIIQREFASGYNIEIEESPMDGIRTLLFLLGEDGRRDFLENLGGALDKYAPYEHRRKWADLLSA